MSNSAIIEEKGHSLCHLSKQITNNTNLNSQIETYLLDINNERYILNIKMAVNKIAIKLEKSIFDIYYYYSTYDLSELKTMNKSFNQFAKIDKAFQFMINQIKNNEYEYKTDKLSICLKIYEVENKDLLFLELILRKKIIQQKKINYIILNSLYNKEKEIKKLSNKISEIDKKYIEKISELKKMNNSYKNKKTEKYFLIFSLLLLLISIVIFDNKKLKQENNKLKNFISNHKNTLRNLNYNDKNVSNILNGIDYCKLNFNLYKINNTLESSIIDNNIVDISFLFVNSSFFKLKLIYVGSIHGDNSKNFYEKYNTSTNILVLIKTKGGNIFGSFQSKENIKNNTGLYSNFDFSISNKKIYESNKTFTKGSDGIIFSTGKFGIYDNFLENGGYYIDSFDKKCEITKGEYNFDVEELELFDVSFKNVVDEKFLDIVKNK